MSGYIHKCSGFRKFMYLLDIEEFQFPGISVVFCKNQELKITIKKEQKPQRMNRNKYTIKYRQLLPSKYVIFFLVLNTSFIRPPLQILFYDASNPSVLFFWNFQNFRVIYIKKENGNIIRYRDCLPVMSQSFYS